MSRYVTTRNLNATRNTNYATRYRRGRPEKPEAEKTQEERVSLRQYYFTTLNLNIILIM